MSQTTPILTLVTGLPGAGKTTVAKILAEQSEAVILNSDETRRELFPIRRVYTPEETRAVISETEERTRRLLKRGQSVILDALFTKQKPRSWYRDLAKQMGVNFRIILVVTPGELIEERLEKRPHTNDPSEATFAYYLDRKKHFEPVQGNHSVIDNSGDLETLKSKIVENSL